MSGINAKADHEEIAYFFPTAPVYNKINFKQSAQKRCQVHPCLMYDTQTDKKAKNH